MSDRMSDALSYKCDAGWLARWLARSYRKRPSDVSFTCGAYGFTFAPDVGSPGLILLLVFTKRKCRNTQKSGLLITDRPFAKGYSLASFARFFSRRLRAYSLPFLRNSLFFSCSASSSGVGSDVGISTFPMNLR